MQELDLTQGQEQEVVEGSPVIELDASGDSAGLDGLVETLQATATDFRVTDFKCAKCGLPHGHDTDKHRASDSFALTHDEAAGMEFNPNCHCGYNELAHRGKSEYGVTDAPSPASASDTAPTPNHVQRQLREA